MLSMMTSIVGSNAMLMMAYDDLEYGVDDDIRV